MGSYPTPNKNKAVILLIKSGMTFHSIRKAFGEVVESDLKDKRNFMRTWRRAHDLYSPEEVKYNELGRKNELPDIKTQN